MDSILHTDSTGHDRIENWIYRSVIGKLNYFANNTRPDISMAVPSMRPLLLQPQHKLAVKCIAYYLLKTRTQGMVLRPTTNLSLFMIVDADFAGRWHKEYSDL